MLKKTRGYWGRKSKTYRNAKQQLIKSMQYATRDRRRKKREFRSLWITRLAAAARLNGLSYSRLIDGLKKANVRLDRKSLSEIAIRDPQGFQEISKVAQAALAA